MNDHVDVIEIGLAIALLSGLFWFGRMSISKGRVQGLILVGIGLLFVLAADQLGAFSTDWFQRHRLFVGSVLLGGALFAVIEVGRWLFSFGWKILVGLVGAGMVGFYGAYRADAFTDACWGTGSGYQIGLQTDMLSKIFHEPLPADFELISFECSGFQDFAIDAELRLQGDDGHEMMLALERTFEHDQNHHLFKDSEKRKTVTGYPDVIVTKFELPASQITYAQIVTITQPRDDGDRWTVHVDAFQW